MYYHATISTTLSMLICYVVENLHNPCRCLLGAVQIFCTHAGKYERIEFVWMELEQGRSDDVFSGDLDMDRDKQEKSCHAVLRDCVNGDVRGRLFDGPWYILES